MSRISKSKILLLGIFFFGILIIYIPNNSIAFSPKYVPSSNPTTPFEFVVNTAYLSISLYLDHPSYYNQVNLNADTPYFFYWGTDASGLEIKMEKTDGSFIVFETVNQEWNSSAILIEVAESGIYNITMTNSSISATSPFYRTQFSGTGFFTIDNLTLGESYSRDIGFTTSQVCIAYYNFSVSRYQQQSGTRSHYYLWSSLSDLNSDYYNLNPNIDPLFNGMNGTKINVLGRYIVYNEGTSIPKIGFYGTIKNETSKSISSFSPVLIIGISFITLLMISYKIKRKKTKTPKNYNL